MAKARMKQTDVTGGERKFQGFSRASFTFLKNIRTHNDKTWFEAHRREYEQHLLNPLRDLVTDLADFVLGIDLSFEVAPAVNKTISRIYRDTRFSEDKSPLRDCAWIVFKRPGKDWARYTAGYFLEINATWYRYGLGFYDAAPDVMAQFRRQIDDDPESFLKAVAWFDKQDPFALEGETYKRPRGQDKPEPIRTWYNYKSFYLSCNRKIDQAILSARLVDDLKAGFGMTAPLYHYLLKTVQSLP
ncbi:MAG: DUF2461 domain-containing protein [Sedimentisphaerales bacterium]|nr:DUF2461 domain-containing protein [Sedimentisphaerales bacterium]